MQNQQNMFCCFFLGFQMRNKFLLKCPINKNLKKTAYFLVMVTPYSKQQIVMSKCSYILIINAR